MPYGRNFRLRKKANPVPDAIPANEDPDIDEPVAITFKDVEEERIKREKTIKSAILASKKKGKGKSKAKDEFKKSVTFSHPTDSDDKALEFSDDEENAREFDKMDDDYEHEVLNNDDNDISFDEFLKAPKVKKAKKSAQNSDVAKEFDLADTFDFRKYLPKSILNEYDKEVEVDSDSDEELANAFMEGQYKDYSDDDDEEPKSKKLKKKGKKKTQEARSLPTPSQPGGERKRHKRGGRRFHKKYSAAPRVIIPSRQNTASMIRQRTETFIKERLFGASRKVRGPRRYTGEEEIARARLQSRARRL